ncbi:MAG TPA: YeeE/YedE family protein [Albitalea sp.]|nr:YeeE/YedE family protein [Albitalea sp.]
MTIAWNAFTPWSALAGGVLIGLAASLFVLGNGRIAGIAGIVGAMLHALRHGRLGTQRLGLAFLAGLFAAPWLWQLVAPLPPSAVDIGTPALVASGLLVGVGVRMGGGCTSGHGVCGLSRLSPRSLVATLVFMAVGMLTVFVLRHLGAGAGA